MKYTPPTGIGYWKESAKRWKVRVGKRYLGETGKPYAKIFKSEAAAVAWMRGKAKEKHGDLQTAKRFDLTPHQLSEAVVAINRLNGKASLIDVVDYWVKMQRESISVQEAIDKLIAQKEGVEERSKRHVKDTREKLERMFRHHLKTPISAVSDDTMTSLVLERDGNGNPPSTSQKAKRIRYANILFRFAIKRKWCVGNPLVSVDKPAIKGKPVQVLTPQEVAGLLLQCHYLKPDLIPPLAMKIFSGIRNSELFALSWDDVDLESEEITVRAAFSKTSRERIIKISSPLARWLKGKKPVPALGSSGLPLPLPFVFSLRPTRKNREQAWYQEIRPIAKAAKINPWPQNALRHVFGSYHYAKFSNENLTATEMGNSPSVIKRHYVNAVKKADCDRFWRISNPATAESIWDTDPLPDTAQTGTLDAEDPGES